MAPTGHWPEQEVSLITFPELSFPNSSPQGPFPSISSHCSWFPQSSLIP